jgi:hypothetical protein
MTEFLKVVEFLPGTKFAKKMICNLCGETVYQVNDRPTREEMNLEIVGLTAHVSIQHGLKFDLVECKDPKCGKKH